MPGDVDTQTTRITNADAGTWTDHGGGQGSSTNTDVFIQGTATRGRRSDNTTSHGFSFDNAVNIDLSGPEEHVGFWYWCTHPAQLNATTDATPGVLIRIGTSTTNYDGHDALGNDNYGDEAGWRRVWIDVSRAPDTTGGTGLNEAQARYFGQETTIGNVGGAAQNVMLDAIDYTTTGLLVTSGTVASPATFNDFILEDWDNTSNRFGIVQSVQGGILTYGRLIIGDQNRITTFDDEGFNIIFADQTLCSSGFMGITVSVDYSGSTVDFGAGTIQSAGTTRLGDLQVVDISGWFNSNGTTYVGMRDMVLTTRSTMTNCLFRNCNSMTQSSAILDGCTITNANTADGVAFIISDNIARIKNCDFTFSDGHAIEITASGTYALDNNTFTGYGSIGTNDAAIYNNSGGAVTLNIINGGSTPTYRNGTGATTTVNNTVTVKVTALDASDSSKVQSARVYLTADAGGDLTEGTVILSGLTDVNGIVQDTGFNYTNDQPVTGRIRRGTTSPLYKTSPIAGTITNNGFDVNIFLIGDE